MVDDLALSHFAPLLSALVASGNRLLNGGFVPSQGGPVCYFAGPLDPAAVRDFIAGDPARLSYEPSADTVHCCHCWAAVTGGSA